MIAYPECFGFSRFKLDNLCFSIRDSAEVLRPAQANCLHIYPGFQHITEHELSPIFLTALLELLKVP